ncbi:hypothetical protein Tco_1495184, partial [Tanacetum coccineum]
QQLRGVQSIPCSPECKTVGQILLDHPLSYALTVTVDVLVVYLQQFWRTVSKVHETLKNPFVTQVNIETIEAFMNVVGYQWVVDKIPQRIEEDYHSIKDDIPLVSVYTTRDVRVQGMLIPDAFLTAKIRATADFKEYETVFMTDTTLTASPQGKKMKQSAGESNDEKVDEKVDEEEGGALRRMCRRQGYMIQNIERKCVTTKQFWKTHKQVNEVLHLDLVSQEFNAQAPKIIKELFKNYVQSNVIQVHPTTITSIETSSLADL